MSKNLVIANNEMLVDGRSAEHDPFLDLFGVWRVEEKQLSFHKNSAPISIFVKQVDAENVGSADNLIDSKQVITYIVVPKDNKTTFKTLSPQINLDKKYSDCSAIISSPLSYENILNLGLTSPSTDVEFVYNLENIKYENAALQAKQENRLPNFYEPQESNAFTKSDVLSILTETLSESTDLRKRFDNIFIPHEAVKQVTKLNALFSQYQQTEKDMFDPTNPYPYSFPYFAKIKLKDETPKPQASDLQEVLPPTTIGNTKDSTDSIGVDTLLMRWYLENKDLFVKSKQFIVTSNMDDPSTATYNLFDFIEWMNYNAPAKLAALPADTKAIQASHESPMSLKLAIDNYKNLPLLAKSLSKVADDFINSFVLSQNSKRFEDTVNGIPGRSELVYHKIEKYEGRSTTNPIQTILIPNSDEKIDYVDTQLFYNKEYSYIIKQIYAIFGCDYKYRSFTDLGNGTFQLVVESYPTIKMVEIPVFLKQGRLIGQPPLSPEVEFFPIRRQGNKIKVCFKANYGMESSIPVSLNNTDNAAVSNIRKLNFMTSNESEIEYNNNSTVARFEIYRSLTKPMAYEKFSTFTNNLFGSVSTMAEDTGLVSDSASAILDLVQDEPYYFVFITRNRLGLASNPTKIYEVIMRGSQGITYPEINIYEPEGLKQTRKPSTVITKFINIRPTAAHIQPDYVKSNLIQQTKDGFTPLSSKNKDIFLGMTDDNIFGGSGTGKKFKFRFKSKNTNKMFDINVTCKNTRVFTEFDRTPDFPKEIPKETAPLLPDIEPQNDNGKHTLEKEININEFKNIDITNAGDNIKKIKRLVPIRKETFKDVAKIQPEQKLVLFPKDN